MATQPVVTGPEVDQETGKFVYHYQPRDSEGQFIGRPYRFLYTDHEDLVKQLTEAKEHGDRFIHEVKTGKRQVMGEPAKAPVSFQPAPESTEETEKKRREEFRRTAEQEFGAPIEAVRDRLKRQQMTEEYIAAQNWAMNKAAEGYYACPENSKKITAWLNEKKYAFTPANYDLAFEELKDTLVKEPQTVTADSTQQPPATQPPVRPQSTGIIPGQFQGTRQPNREEKQPLTRERFRQIDKMSRDEWMKFRRNHPKESEAFLLMKSPAQPQQ